MVDGTGLENRRSVKATEGSNPSLSAINRNRTLCRPRFGFKMRFRFLAVFVGQSSKLFRAKQGLTQDDLAKNANIKYSTLTKIEGGVVTKPSVQTIQKIAKSLGVPMEELLK